ncbi:restriction endonuclease [Bremerella sp. T1]|uniref:restriction endonuclease n=1 Tax=Bremerella sp. TYQ1 TaxID=3119568 RepID=UPI001CC9461A|nr:restriction endonuclease [Bremerella volcania]UBM34370.1 restriction endonuclease [Bremerella volcania]
MPSLNLRLDRAKSLSRKLWSEASVSWQDILLHFRVFIAKLGFDPPIASALIGFAIATLFGLITAIPLGADDTAAFVVLICFVVLVWLGVGVATWFLTRLPNHLPVEAEHYLKSLISDRNNYRANARENALQIDVSISELKRSIKSLNAALEEQRVRDQRLIERQRLLYLNWNTLSGLEFEMRLKEVYELNGYQVELTSNSGDQGGDLIVEHRGRRTCVQAKRWQSSVGNKAVQEAYSGQGFYKCDGCAVVTTSQFTPKAIELAKELNCELIDSDGLRRMIEAGRGAEIRKLASPPPIEDPQPFFNSPNA